MGLVKTIRFVFLCCSMMAFSIFVNDSIAQTMMVDVCFTSRRIGPSAEWCTSEFLICSSGGINITSGQEFTHYDAPRHTWCDYSYCSTNGDLLPDSILITQITTACNGLRNCSINNTVDIRLSTSYAGYVHVNYTCVQDPTSTVRPHTVTEDSYFPTTLPLSEYETSPGASISTAMLKTYPGNGDVKLTTAVVPVVVSVLAVVTVIVVAIAYKCGLCSRVFTLLRRGNFTKDASQDASGMELSYEDLRYGSGSDAADYSHIDSTQGEDNRYYNIHEVYYNA